MTIFLDTSTLARYLLYDDPVKAEATRALLKKGVPILVTTLTISEVAWVMEGHNYRRARMDVCTALAALINEKNVDVHDLSRSRALQAIRFCHSRSVAFADGFLWAQAVDMGAAIATYDRKFPGADVQLLEP